MAVRYVQPNWFTINVFNRLVAALTLLGISVYGTRVLAVRGRKSGEWRTIPINLLEHQGERYLVAPRGVTQWVRNIRTTGAGELRIGWRREPIRVVEVANDDKPDLLRAYLRRWKFEVNLFFHGVDADAAAETLTRIAPDYPIFRILPGLSGN